MPPGRLRALFPFLPTLFALAGLVVSTSAVAAPSSASPFDKKEPPAQTEPATPDASADDSADDAAAPEKKAPSASPFAGGEPKAAEKPAAAPADAATTEPAAAPETTPAAAPETAPAAASPKPAGEQPAGWGGGFGDDDDLGDDDDDDDDEDEDAAGPVRPASEEPSGQLVTIPGAKRYLEPPQRVGASNKPRHSLWMRNILGARYNPLGLRNDNTIGYRLHMIDRESVLFNDTYLLLGARSYLTPAFGRVGPHIELQPIALLNLQASYAYLGYWRGFGLMQSFPSATSDYSDTVLDERQDDDLHYRTRGHALNLQHRLQAKAGPIAIRNTTTWWYQNLRLQDQDPVFFDQTLDIAFPNKGWVVSNDLDAIYLFDSGLRVAARYSLVHAFYRDEHFLPFEPTSQPNSPHHRIGPGVIYQFYSDETRRIDTPTVVLLTQWFVQHRFRTGQDVSRAVPQITLAFVFKGQLLPHPKRRRVKRAGVQEEMDKRAAEKREKERDKAKKKAKKKGDGDEGGGG